jgi:hypothetical protein
MSAAEKDRPHRRRTGRRCRRRWRSCSADRTAAARLFHFLAAAVALGACRPANAERGDKRSFTTESGKTLVVETFVDGLEVPWSMAFTSPTRLLVTERPGRVRVVSNGRLEPKPLAVLTDVEARGESGLMGIALAPDYATSRLLYLSYAYDTSDGPRVRIARFRDDGDRLSGHRDLKAFRRAIPRGLPASLWPGWEALRDAGDATTGKIAQDLKSLGGKTLRLNPDGSIPRTIRFRARSCSRAGTATPRPGLGSAVRAAVQTEPDRPASTGRAAATSQPVEAGKITAAARPPRSRDGLVSPCSSTRPPWRRPEGPAGALLPSFRGLLLHGLRGERQCACVDFGTAGVAQTRRFSGVYGRSGTPFRPDGACTW